MIQSLSFGKGAQTESGSTHAPLRSCILDVARTTSGGDARTKLLEYLQGISGQLFLHQNDEKARSNYQSFDCPYV